jgi:hypothetical protein
MDNEVRPNLINNHHTCLCDPMDSVRPVRAPFHGDSYSTYYLKGVLIMLIESLIIFTLTLLLLLFNDTFYTFNYSFDNLVRLN